MRLKRSLEFYQQKLFEMISECTHGGELDLEEFEGLVSGLQAAASVDGFQDQEFQSLVQISLKQWESHPEFKKAS